MLSIGATTAEELEISSQEDREAAASDLLNVLHRYDLFPAAAALTLS